MIALLQANTFPRLWPGRVGQAARTGYADGVFEPQDLSSLERALLGVLCVGLPPSRAAGSDAFRVDYVTAVVHALQGGLAPEAFLVAPGGGVSAPFRDRLREAIVTLEQKQIVAPVTVGVPAAAGGYEAGLAIDLVDPDTQPAVLDRYLAQRCMEELFLLPAVYPFLMERYSTSGEVWRRLREAGYQRQ